MSLVFHHVDELPNPRPQNMMLIDRKSVLASSTAPTACTIPKHEALLQDIIAGLAPAGGRFCSAETFFPGTRTTPSCRVSVCALPEECSRHNAPSQPHAICDCVRISSGSGNVAIVMCLAHPSHAFAAGCAIARAFPLYVRTQRKRHAGATSPSVPAPWQVSVFLRVPHEEWESVRRDLTAVAEGIQLTARLVDTPPNFLHASAFVEEALKVSDENLKGSGVTTRVIRGQELEAQGFGGLYGVGKAAVEPPALVVLSHRARGDDAIAIGRQQGGVGAGNEDTDRMGSVCFVGKGIVYDSGGLSIKTKTGMPGMKRDMGGAAAVLAAFQAAVKVRMLAVMDGSAPKGMHDLYAVLCIAENSVAANATRPDDVHTLYSGQTVEINNTDAEGRLVLSDGVAYAVRHLNPAVIVDVATLTGAQAIATGRRHAAALSNDERLEQLAMACGRSSGDLVHPVPYCPEFFREEFRSSVADMKNSVADRSNAQVSCAGQFIANHIESFVSGSGRWLHVDMAAPAYQGERATGYGVALLFTLLHQLDNMQQPDEKRRESLSDSQT